MRRMRISYVFGCAYGSYDGISWFMLAEKNKVPVPERIYQPDYRYEIEGRRKAIADLRDCFS